MLDYHKENRQEKMKRSVSGDAGRRCVGLHDELVRSGLALDLVVSRTTEATTTASGASTLSCRSRGTSTRGVSHCSTVSSRLNHGGTSTSGSVTPQIG